jgi:predicted 3-demethylubiquinone-9 3-methyltransferase (glyoxalase superfamily)
MNEITPCLWFDTEGEDAANRYTSVFPNSRIVDVARYGSAGPRPEGTVMMVSFELDGEKFLALSGGPEFTFSEAVSFQVSCESQEEVTELLGDPDREKSQRVMEAMLKMKKIDVPTLERAAAEV